MVSVCCVVCAATWFKCDARCFIDVGEVCVCVWRARVYMFVCVRAREDIAGWGAHQNGAGSKCRSQATGLLIQAQGQQGADL